MKHSEIVKLFDEALKACSQGKGNKDCEKCPLEDVRYTSLEQRLCECVDIFIMGGHEIEEG